MSTLRSNDDTWDIASSVGVTAVMVAAARARLEAFSPASCGRALQAAVAQALARPSRSWRARLVAGVLSRLV